jgi:hypothetical protein
MTFNTEEASYDKVSTAKRVDAREVFGYIDAGLKPKETCDEQTMLPVQQQI